VDGAERGGVEGHSGEELGVAVRFLFVWRKKVRPTFFNPGGKQTLKKERRKKEGKG
jgi:hypothetical protein